MRALYPLLCGPVALAAAFPSRPVLRVRASSSGTERCMWALLQAKSAGRGIRTCRLQRNCSSCRCVVVACAPACAHLWYACVSVSAPWRVPEGVGVVTPQDPKLWRDLWSKLVVHVIRLRFKSKQSKRGLCSPRPLSILVRAVQDPILDPLTRPVIHWTISCCRQREAMMGRWFGVRCSRH